MKRQEAAAMLVREGTRTGPAGWLFTWEMTSINPASQGGVMPSTSGPLPEEGHGWDGLREFNESEWQKTIAYKPIP